MFVNMIQQVSILDNFETHEYIDIKKLDKLINSSLLKDTFNNPFVKYGNEKKQLLAYKQLFKNGKAKILYVRSQKIQYGRVNPYKALGLHCIRREIRHTLANDLYVDIDIVNAHPVILNQVCDKLNIPHNLLNHYVCNRNKIINDFNKLYGFEGKDEFKKVSNRIINGGSYNLWLQENELTAKFDFLIDFHNEMKTIRQQLISLNKSMYDDIAKYNATNRKEKNNEASFISYYLQNIENSILEEIYNYCKLNKLIKKSVVLSNDGLMILKEKYDDSLLTKFKEIIKNTFDLDIEYIKKPFDKAYTDDEIDKAQLKTDTNELFENVKMFNHFDYAKLFYNINDDKYIYNDKLKWFEYKDNNILKQCVGVPVGLNNHITESLRNYFKNEFNDLDPNNKHFMEYSKLYQSSYKNLGNTKYINSIIEKLQEFYNIDDLYEKLDSNYNLLAFNDKVYDLDIKGYRNIRKDDYISKFINLEAPDNTAQSANAINTDILNFINSIMSCEENAQFLLKILGNSLFGNKYEKLYILTGSGGNGKGVLCDLIENSLQSYYYQANSQFLTSKYRSGSANESLFNCINKRIVCINEPEQSEADKDLTFNLEFLKKITSNETVETRGLYKSAVSFKAKFTTFVQTNELPRLDKIEDAIKRRFVNITFPYTFVENPISSNQKKINYSLKTKFNDPLYHREFIKILLDNVDLGEKLNIPTNIVDTTKEYLEDNNFVGHFINQYLDITGDKKDYIKSSELYNMYKEAKLLYLSPQKFKSQMVNNGLSPILLKGSSIYRGIKIKEENEDDAHSSNDILDV